MCKSVFHSRQGFSLIEAALVLGIVGLVIGGIWIAAASVSNNHKIAQMAGDVLVACDRATTVFSSQAAPGSYQDITDKGIDAGIYPANWIRGRTITPPIGTYMVTYWMDASQGDETRGEVRMNYDNITQAQCLQLMSKVSGASGSLIRKVEIGVGPGWTPSTVFILPYRGSFDAACAVGPALHIEFSCTAKS